MIDPANASFFQFASGHDGLRVYKTYTSSHTVEAGAYGSEYYYNWHIPIYNGDTSSSGLNRYILYVYARATGGPNNSSRWYDLQQYPLIITYRETSGGAAKNFSCSVSGNTGEVVIDINDTDFGAGTTVYDDVTIDVTVHILSLPTILIE